MIAVGVIAALLTAIFATRAGIRASYGKDGFKLWIIIGFVKKELKMPEKREKTEEKSAEAVKTPETSIAEEMPEKSADKTENKPSGKKAVPLLDSYDKRKLVKLAFRALPRMIKLPRIDLLEFHYVAGGESADRTAVRYGKMCAALGAGLPFLHNGMRVKKQIITTNLDYGCVKQEFSGKIQVTVTIGAVFAFGVWALIEFAKCRSKAEPQEKASV